MLTSEQIQLICTEFDNRSSIAGILLCGSYVYGVPTELSDLDIRFVSSDGSNLDARQTWRFGTRIELFVNSPERIRAYFDECIQTRKPYAVHFWAHGKIVLDRTGIIDALQREARNAWRKGPAVGSWEHQDKWKNRSVVYRAL